MYQLRFHCRDSRIEEKETDLANGKGTLHPHQRDSGEDDTSLPDSIHFDLATIDVPQVVKELWIAHGHLLFQVGKMNLVELVRCQKAQRLLKPTKYSKFA